VVVGGGPAGMLAALLAARSGERAVLIERAAQLGGLAASTVHEGHHFDRGPCFARATGVPELDALCAWAEATEGVVGARLTGAGFGGCALVLVAPAAVAGVREALVARFEGRFGKTPRTFVVRAGEGASPLD